MATTELRDKRTTGSSELSTVDGNGGGSGMIDVASTRAAQEVQAAMVIAKRFPRDEAQAFARVMRSCKRKGLAESAIYSYPRGGTKVEGPSIRLAEELARCWGNVDFGVIELEQRYGESTVMAYAWDLETNTRETKVFTVKHERYTRNGSYSLTDPRDVYEMVANQGARRLRACILGIIPGDVQDAAVLEINKTLAGNNSEPLQDRVRTIATAFDAIGVSKGRIESKLGHNLDCVSETELVGLRKAYTAIKDGMATVEQHFPQEQQAKSADTGKSKSEQMVDELGERLTGGNTGGGDAKPESKPERTSDPTGLIDSLAGCQKIGDVKDQEFIASQNLTSEAMEIFKVAAEERKEQIRSGRGGKSGELPLE